jgi:hypothetical protein
MKNYNGTPAVSWGRSFRLRHLGSSPPTTTPTSGLTRYDFVPSCYKAPKTHRAFGPKTTNIIRTKWQSPLFSIVIGHGGSVTEKIIQEGKKRGEEENL